MTLSININTADGLSDQDIKIIGAIAGAVGANVASMVTTTAKAAELAAQVGAATTAKKAVVKPAPKTAESEPAPEPEEDLVGGDGSTLEDAVALATKLMAEGRAKEIKAALTDIGAEKVSKLTGSQITDFVAAFPED